MAAGSGGGRARGGEAGSRRRPRCVPPAELCVCPVSEARASETRARVCRERERERRRRGGQREESTQAVGCLEETGTA
eukprot:898474-Rhodomonas_salina.1